MDTTRTVICEGQEIAYRLERKPVKNLNLRIRKDGSVWVSASGEVPAEDVDAFVAGRGKYILTAIRRFREMERYAPAPRQYATGETYTILGRGLRLKVTQGEKPGVTSDGVYIYLCVKDERDFAAKQRLMERYLDKRRRGVFGEILAQTYPTFEKYGVAMPRLFVRDMQTRWGSCAAHRGVITLNKQLLEAPRSCIEYVVMHELCHMIHPNHSARFYTFLTALMPDWKERKRVLEKCAGYGV